MDLTREQQVYAIYSEAVELPPEQWLMFIDRACEGNHELCREVEDLLLHEFLDVSHEGENQASYALGENVLEDAAELLPTPFAVNILANGTEVADTYKIHRVVGRGGMGVVYQAHHMRTKRLVALKVLPPHLHNNGNDRSTIRRFKREAEIIGRLTNPHIVQVQDVNEGTFNGEPIFFIVMEWIEGKTLAQILKESGYLSLDRIVNILHQIVDALQEVHQCGLTHCDLKPANIMLQLESNVANHVKVVDFGLAREDNIETTQRFNTPAYASPEQLLRNQADHRSDIFSLGIILYEMLAGERPFEITAAVGDVPIPSLQKRRPEVPVAIENLLACMLEVDPNKRPQLVRDIPILFEQARKSNITRKMTAISPITKKSTEQRADPKLKMQQSRLRGEIKLGAQERKHEVESLIIQGEESIKTKDYKRAIIFFERAQQLAPQDSYVMTRVVDIRRLTQKKYYQRSEYHKRREYFYIREASYLELPHDIFAYYIEQIKNGDKLVISIIIVIVVMLLVGIYNWL